LILHFPGSGMERGQNDKKAQKRTFLNLLTEIKYSMSRGERQEKFIDSAQAFDTAHADDILACVFSIGRIQSARAPF